MRNHTVAFLFRYGSASDWLSLCAFMQLAKEICHTTKRTHRFSGLFFIQKLIHLILTPETQKEFGGFVLEKRTHR